jgi:hypothetical protein
VQTAKQGDGDDKAASRKRGAIDPLVTMAREVQINEDPAAYVRRCRPALCVSPAATRACRHPRCMRCLHCKRAWGLMDSGGTGASKARARVRPPSAVHATARPNMCALLLLQRAVDNRANRHICEAAGCRSRHEACSGAGGAAILLGERNPLARLSGTHPRPAPSASIRRGCE